MAITSINLGNDIHANYINSREKQQGGDNTFDKIKTEVIQNLRSLKIKKPELYEILKIAVHYRIL